MIWFLANRFIQDTWWGLVILDKFAEYFVLPAVLLPLILLFARKKRMLFSCVIPVLICAYFYAPFFFTVSSPESLPPGTGLRVATFNIWNHNTAFTELAEIIRNSNTDVIALQEVTEVQREPLTDLISSTHPYYYISKPVYGGTTALFSRYKLDNIEEIDVDIDRPSIIADFLWNGSTITVISAHLNPSFWAYSNQPLLQIPGNYLQYIKDQNSQATAIIDEMNNRASAATFLACDCNSQETASTNRLLRKHFQDTFRSLGWQSGTTDSPHLSYERKLSHIDYIWFTGMAKPNAIFRSVESAGSDHDLLVAEYKIQHRDN